MANNEDNMKELRRTLIIAVVVMIIAIFGVYLVHKFVVPNSVPLTDSNLTIVLSFIGVLATFIVIGNFAQVSDIRRQMEQNLEDIKTKEIGSIKTGLHTLDEKIIEHTASITGLNTQVNGVDASIVAINARIDGIDETIASNKESYEKYAQEQVSEESVRLRVALKQYKRLVIEALFASYGDIVKVENAINKLISPLNEDTFTLGVYGKNGYKTIITKAKLTNKDLIFTDEEGEQVAASSIRKIDSIDIKPHQLYKLYCLYQDTITLKVDNYSENVAALRTDKTLEVEGVDNRFEIN